MESGKKKEREAVAAERVNTNASGGSTRGTSGKLEGKERATDGVSCILGGRF